MRFQFLTPQWTETDATDSAGKALPLRQVVVRHDARWSGDMDGAGIGTYVM